jgi:hypothetical protein
MGFGSSRIEPHRGPQKAGRSRGVSVPWCRSKGHERLRDRTKADYLAKIETAFGDLPLDALDDPRVTRDFLYWRGSMASSPRQADYAWTKHKVERHVSPEIAEARAATLKAMKEAEVGWQKAIDKIAERAGLTKGPDGTWRDPSMSEAA